MYNKTILIGRLGRDPETRFTNSGQQVTAFSVATDKQYTDKNGEKVKRTIWMRVSAWGKLAEITAKYLVKGSLVYIEGELNADENGNPRIWTKTDGTAGSSFELNANNIIFLSKREKDEVEQVTMTEDEGEIPF